MLTGWGEGTLARLDDDRKRKGVSEGLEPFAGRRCGIRSRRPVFLLGDVRLERLSRGQVLALADETVANADQHQ